VTDQSPQLRLVRPVDRLATDVGLAGGGAVPVHVVAAGAPASAVVLADRDLEVRRAIGALGFAIRPPQRQLPAYVGLGLQRMHAVAQRVPVQRAAGPAGEAGAVVEDACTVDHPGLALAVLVGVHDAAAQSLGSQLPVVGAESGRELPNATLVVGVGEVRAVGAAAVVWTVGVDARASLAEDARPARRQPGQITPDDLAGVGRVGELDPGPGGRRAKLHAFDPTRIRRCPGEYREANRQ